MAVVIVVMIVVMMFTIIMIVSVPVVIPMVIVLDAPVVALPEAFIETAALIVRNRPRSAGIRRPSPVAVVPSPMVAYGIPIALDPDPARSGSHWPDT